MGRPESQLRGRPPVVHREDVFAAADALCRKGQRPTGRTVAAHMGFGNCNRTHVFVGEWWRSLPERLEASQELEQLKAKTAALLHELSLCNIRHWEPSRQEHLDNLMSEVQVRVKVNPDRKQSIPG